MSGGSFIGSQNFYGKVHNVYNVNGDLILSDQSDISDMARELKALRDQLADEPSVSKKVRERAVSEIETAIEESRSAKPEAPKIQQWLESAANTLKGAQGVGKSALDLAKTIGAVAEWAKLVLA